MIKVFINEPSGGLTDQSARLWYGGQNNFTLIRGQRGTAQIVFEIAAGDSYQSTVGSPVYVHEISSVSPLYDVIVFAGRIQKIEKKWIGNNGDHDDTLTCVSLESCFDTIRIDPPVSYSGMTGGAIITAIFNTYCSGVPVTLGTIDLTAGGVLPMQVYRQSERVSDTFTALATLMGTTIIWGVQMSDQTLYAQTVSTTPAPFTLDSYLFETGDWIEDETDYRNRQLVQGSFTAFSTSNEMFPGDNVSHSVRLRVPVDRVTTAMLTKATQATATGIFGTLSPLSVNRPAVGDTFSITPPHSPPVVEDPYTWVDVLDNTLRNQVLRGADAEGDCQNAVDAINANPLKAGITFSLPTWENDACNADPPLVGANPPAFVLRVKNPGVGGNGCILTSVHTLSPFVAGALVWQGGSLSPLVPPQTLGGTDGVSSALQVSVSGSNTLSTDVEYTPGSNLITITAAIPGGTSLSIAYYRLGGDTVAVEDSAAVAIRAAAEHGTGKYQQLITDTQNADARAIYIEALQALNAYKTIPESFQFTIYQALLSPGQLLTISISSPTGAPALLDGTWLVQEIQAVIVPGVETLPEPYGHFQYTVTVINTNIISTFVDFWENLAIVTPAGAQTVNNISTTSATPSLNPPLPNNTIPPPGTPPNTTGTLSPSPGGQQWIQEALGRYAQWKASDLVVDAAVNTRVTSASHPFVGGDVGSHIIIITNAGGFTPGEYIITSLTGTAANLGGSPAAVGSTGGVWSLVNNDLWCTTYNISPSFNGNAVAIISKNADALNPFQLGAIGPTPGGGDYTLQKGNQVLFSSTPDPSTDRLMATYFPAGITPAPVGPSAATLSVIIDVQATDNPQPYTPHVPPGSDRHFYDVACGTPSGATGVTQEALATIAVVGTTDLGVTWSLVSSDAVTTDASKIGFLSYSIFNPALGRIYNAPPVLPSTLTPPLPNTVVLGVTSHADTSKQAFNTITLVPGVTPPSGTFAAIAFFPTGDVFETSPDAATWTGRSSPINSGGGLCIVRGTSQFVALGIDSTFTTDQALTSPDGVAWTSRTVPAASLSPYQGVIYAGGQFLGFDQNGQIITSTDGITWSVVATITPPSGGWTDIAYGAGVYALVGTGDSAHAVATSPDGVTWTTRNTAFPGLNPNSQWIGICFAAGQFVCVPAAALDPFNSATVMTSPDGVTWSPHAIDGTDPVAVTARTVTYGAGTYVAVNSGGDVYTSVDGDTWVHLTPGLNAGDSAKIRFLNGEFVVCAGAATGSGTQIYTSPDGVTWTARTSAITQFVSDVAFG